MPSGIFVASMYGAAGGLGERHALVGIALAARTCRRATSMSSDVGLELVGDDLAWPSRRPSRPRGRPRRRRPPASASRTCPGPSGPSPCRRGRPRRRSGRMPRRSATIWAKPVSWPWPCGEAPVKTVTTPVGWTRTSADSYRPSLQAEAARPDGPRRREAADLGVRREADPAEDALLAQRAPARRGSSMSTSRAACRACPRSCPSRTMTPTASRRGSPPSG